MVVFVNGIGQLSIPWFVASQMDLFFIIKLKCQFVKVDLFWTQSNKDL